MNYYRIDITMNVTGDIIETIYVEIEKDSDNLMNIVYSKLYEWADKYVIMPMDDIDIGKDIELCKLKSLYVKCHGLPPDLLARYVVCCVSQEEYVEGLLD